MDQREPPRKNPPAQRLPGRDPAAVELEVPVQLEPGVDRPAPSRLGALPSYRLGPEATHSFPRQLGLIAGIVTVVVLLGTTVCVLVARRLGAYVQDLPAYQVDRRGIVLEPAPPPCFRGGAARLVDAVWGRAGLPSTLSTLDLDGDKLLKQLRLHPWVRRARRLEVIGSPGRVVVQLDYRIPVAVARLGDDSRVIVDEEGVILPSADIDQEAAEPLVLLDKFDPPAEPKPGEFWESLDPRTHVRRPDPKVASAALLAGFLRGKLATLAPLVSLPVYLHVIPYGDGHYLQLSCVDRHGDKLMVCWDDPWAPAALRKLPPRAKWDMLLDWIRRNPLGRNEVAIFLEFTADGIVRKLAPEGAPATGSRGPAGRRG